MAVLKMCPRAPCLCPDKAAGHFDSGLASRLSSPNAADDPPVDLHGCMRVVD
jgi:hypothetical protein